ncbi:MAG: deoxyribodipyrimidine photolyase [Actinobacteria bacterium]|jgi:deoxyribodipyrimidine photolyase-related protein|nr:deoxyribodipyrimidine photolyase [Actinomycetota bacterium]NCX75529.1 deoxyribodipyrimidine photolyase [Actinomycetota bacterium]NDE95660.1 deoxyribodipyrimidine photolyase [Actinomycetota bacterium]
MPKTLIYLAHDNLNRHKGALKDADPKKHEVIFVESNRMLTGARWHRQRIFFLLSAARHFAESLRKEGFTVHYEKSRDTASGISEFADNYEAVIATAPSSYRLTKNLLEIGVKFVPNDFFLTSRETFSSWANSQKSLKMESFYRFQRERLNILMDDGEPVGGKWNFDEANRLPPPKLGHSWPSYPEHERDEIDREVIAEIESLDLVGRLTDRTWGTTREAALAQLDRFLKDSFRDFGPYEDAMTSESWALNHSLLSTYMNVGLITPDEIVAEALKRFKRGGISIASCEGFIRQIIGWREYINGLYWYFGNEYRDLNEFSSTRKLLPLFSDSSKTKMRCVSEIISQIEERSWVHHIPRLMVLSNLAALADVKPAEFLAWMREVFIDATDWVMVPNVIGMSLHADGGKMSTKPYVAGGAYISRMSNYCGSCAYNPKTRIQEDSCPFTTLYWHYMARNGERFKKNHRMFQQLSGLKKLSDLDATIKRGNEVIKGLEEGKI